MYEESVDWISAASLLSSETFTTSSTFDALNRVVTLTTPDASVYIPTYNEANLLETVSVKIRGSSTATIFVQNIDYNARGQRTLIGYAGTSSAAFTTTYSYDAMTFRLSEQVTTRASDSAVLQDFSPVYDPVGNIVEVVDAADQTLYFSGSAPVGAGTQYVYDAIYRLTSATGREHPGQTQPETMTGLDSPLTTVPHPNNTQAMRAYTETYNYDQVGNILAMLHSASGANWNRHYTYASGNNKLATTEMPGDPSGGPYSGTYSHDARGNMTSMPHLSAIAWDWADRMQSANLGGGGNVYFTYDASGQRVRKVWDKTSALRDERIYLGGYELWRESSVSGGVATVQIERQTLHVMDDTRRIAMVETKTIVGGSVVGSPVSRQRFEIGNQLDSASIEVTEAAAIISYEETFPFGATSFHSQDGSIDVSAKRFRYTGKERDEETALYYYGARYYAPWLGRWTAVDPSSEDGPNGYVYVRDCPILLHDPNGRESRPGLSVSGESKLSAAQLVAMIKQNTHIPSWIRDAFSASGNRLLVASKIRLPKGVVQADIPEWFQSAATAIQSGQWHFTTGAASASADEQRPDEKLRADFEPGDRPVGAQPKTGGVTTGETIDPDPKTMTAGRHMRDLTAGADATPSYRQEGQGLLVVATRFLSAGNVDPREEKRSEDAILDTLFHELAAHAGLHSQGKPDTHGDPTVEALAGEVDKVFQPAEQEKIVALRRPSAAAQRLIEDALAAVRGGKPTVMPTVLTPDQLVTRELLRATLPPPPHPAPVPHPTTRSPSP